MLAGLLCVVALDSKSSAEATVLTLAIDLRSLIRTLDQWSFNTTRTAHPAEALPQEQNGLETSAVSLHGLPFR